LANAIAEERRSRSRTDRINIRPPRPEYRSVDDLRRYLVTRPDRHVEAHELVALALPLLLGNSPDLVCIAGAQRAKDGASKKSAAAPPPATADVKTADGKTYLVIGEHKPFNKELASYADKTVTLKGKLVERWAKAGTMAQTERGRLFCDVYEAVVRKDWQKAQTLVQQYRRQAGDPDDFSYVAGLAYLESGQADSARTVASMASRMCSGLKTGFPLGVTASGSPVKAPCTQRGIGLGVPGP
jgi:hypothetical protein